MTQQPNLALRVSHVSDSLQFYVDRVGFELIEGHTSGDTAMFRDSDGDLILLAGPNAVDLPSLLASKHRILDPGETIGFSGSDVEARRADMIRRGIVEPQLLHMRWGDRVLRVLDPDGYILNFWQSAQRTQQESIDLYAAGLHELEAILADLSESDLDLSRSPDDWTIRQIVHHIADGDLLFVQGLTMALAEPGRRYIQNWPSDNVPYNENLHYRTRPIASSLAVIRAIRTHFVELMQYVPDAWGRAVYDDDGNAWSFGRFMNIDIRHAFEHIDEIREIRQIHGR